MKITIKKLSRYSKPCEAGVEWLKLQKDHTLSALVKTVIENKPFKYGNKIWYPLDFALWALPQLMTKRQAVQFAVYAAREVLGIFEAEYPNDDRPRLAVEAAEAWLKNPCLATAEAARAAAGAAWAAARVAAWAETGAGPAAAEAAAGAGPAAAEAAAGAARAVAGAAAWAETGAAAWAVAGAAAEAIKLETQTKILHYGVKLLVGGKK